MNAPLPWFIAGPLIGLLVPALLILREKQFGVSSSYRFIGGVLLPKIPYFSYHKDGDRWQIQFALGLILSGFAAYHVFGAFDAVVVQPVLDYEKLAMNIYDVKNGLQFYLKKNFLI
jgi:hypothetical protein